MKDLRSKTTRQLDLKRKTEANRQLDLKRKMKANRQLDLKRSRKMRQARILVHKHPLSGFYQGRLSLSLSFIITLSGDPSYSLA